MRVLMLVATTVVTDTRVLREARTLAAAEPVALRARVGRAVVVGVRLAGSPFVGHGAPVAGCSCGVHPTVRGCPVSTRLVSRERISPAVAAYAGGGT